MEQTHFCTISDRFVVEGLTMEIVYEYWGKGKWRATATLAKGYSAIELYAEVVTKPTTLEEMMATHRRRTAAMLGVVSDKVWTEKGA